jgi:hypothetical protein
VLVRRFFRDLLPGALRVRLWSRHTVPTNGLDITRIIHRLSIRTKHVMPVVRSRRPARLSSLSKQTGFT